MAKKKKPQQLSALTHDLAVSKSSPNTERPLQPSWTPTSLALTTALGWPGKAHSLTLSPRERQDHRDGSGLLYLQGSTVKYSENGVWVSSVLEQKAQNILGTYGDIEIEVQGAGGGEGTGAWGPYLQAFCVQYHKAR